MKILIDSSTDMKILIMLIQSKVFTRIAEHWCSFRDRFVYLC
jgi:hypothetical protein